MERNKAYIVTYNFLYSSTSVTIPSMLFPYMVTSLTALLPLQLCFRYDVISITVLLPLHRSFPHSITSITALLPSGSKCFSLVIPSLCTSI